MDWIFVTAAVLCAWVLVSLTGYERQRRTDSATARPALPHDPGQPTAA